MSHGSSDGQKWSSRMRDSFQLCSAIWDGLTYSYIFLQLQYILYKVLALRLYFLYFLLIHTKFHRYNMTNS